MSRRTETEHRLRVAVIEQALELGLHRLAEAADRSNDQTELVEVAVAEVRRVLELPEDTADAIRFALTAGVLVGRLAAMLPSTGTAAPGTIRDG
jgi:hypothetical protein